MKTIKIELMKEVPGHYYTRKHSVTILVSTDWVEIPEHVATQLHALALEILNGKPE